MAGNIKGITIEIGADVQPLNKALEGVNKTTKSIQDELKQVDRLLKLDPSNTELLAQKQKLLADAVQNTKSKLDTLKEAQKQAQVQLERGEIAEEQYRAISREVIATENQLKKLESQIKQVNVGWQDTGEKFQKFGESAKNAGEKLMPISLATGAIIAGAGAAAMDLESMGAKYNTVFDGFTDQAQEFIDEFQKLTPATEAQARAMTAGIQDLLVPMGFTRKEATNMTGEFTHLIGALTNFNSGTETSESVATKFQAAITGEVSGLKALGIQLDIDTLKQKAVEKGYAASTSEVDKQALAMILLEEAYKQSGDALAAYTEENLDAKTKAGLMKTELIDMAAKLGEVLLPIINAVIDVVRNVISNFNNMSDTTKIIIITILTLVAAIGPLLIIIGQVSIGIGAIIKVIGIFTGATSVATGATGLFGGVIAALTSPIGIAIVAITAIIAIIVTLWKTNEDFRTFVTGIWKSIQDMFKNATQGISRTIDAAFTWISDFIKANGDNIKAIVDVYWNEIKEILSTTTEVIKNIVDTVFSWISDFWKTHGDTLTAIAKTAWGLIKAIIDSNLQAIKGIFQVFKGIFTGDWQTFTEGLKNMWQGMWTGISTILSGAWSVLSGAFGTLKTNIKGWFDELIASAKQWGKNLISGFADGIRSMVGAVRNSVNSVMNEVADFIGFNSPSKKGEGRHIVTWGENMIAGFIDGINSSLPELEKVMSSAISAPTNNYSTQNQFKVQATVRNDTDINRIAKELFSLQQKSNRGRGINSI